MSLKKSQAKELRHHGNLSLMFDKNNNKTRLKNCYQTPPLKASRAMYLHPTNPSQATVYMMESSGGLVAGDQNDFQIEISDGADVCLIPQSATKIYPSFNGRWSSQSIDITIGKNASLSWNTEAIIPFKMAKFHGKTIIHMAGDASLLWGEILSPGRDKRGEKYQYSHVKTNFQVWIDEECVIYDALSLTPNDTDLGQIGLLEDYLYVGSLWFVAPKVNEVNMQALNERLHQSTNMKLAASLLDEKAINIRGLASDMVLLKQEMEKVRSELTLFIN